MDQGVIASARPAALQSAYERAEEICGASRWNLTLFPRGSAMVDIVGRGEAAGRAFSAQSPAVRLTSDRGEDTMPVAVAELEGRLAAVADRFHSALPMPVWTDRLTASLTAREKVERARAEYVGARLVAIRLGPADWLAYALETGIDPGSREHMRDDGIAVRRGEDLRYEISPE